MHRFLSITGLQIVFGSLLPSSFAAVPYAEYILAPSSRILYPESVYKVNGSVTGAFNLLEGGHGSATFNGLSAVTFDYAKDIGGVLSVTAGSSSSPSAYIGIAFSESNIWINSNASDATADYGLDEVIWLHVGAGSGLYTLDRDHERGGFRYLSLITNSSASVEITNVSTYFTAAPASEDLQAYSGYFHCNDELLNRIWYAGAYTNQLCTIDPIHGNSLIHLFENITGQQAPLAPGQTQTWYNNKTIANGTSVLVDGAKRDRLIWPGDLTIGLPTVFVSTNDLKTIENSIDSIFPLQNMSTGMLPYAGIGFAQLGIESFTYHLYTLIGLGYYYHYSGNLSYVQKYWNQYKLGMSWSLSHIDTTGMMNVTAPADWLRIGMGGHNIEANSILHYTLNQGIALASLLNDSTVNNWTTFAANLKTAANALLWNSTAGLYHDNETTTLFPQDGNVWAVKSGVASANQSARISTSLKSRWTPYGAPAPEAGTTAAHSALTISPFITGVELEAHFLAAQPDSALELMRTQWGFMLDDPRMTNSTWIEGYSADGSLHYAPYHNDPRVNFAHAWGSAPTSVLSFYVAGLQFESAGGKNWRIEPQVGNLTTVEAGFRSGLGNFAVTLTASNGIVTGLNFSTPTGTDGSVVLKGATGILKSEAGRTVLLVDGMASGLEGGGWTLLSTPNGTASGTGSSTSSGPTTTFTGDGVNCSPNWMAMRGLVVLLIVGRYL